MLIYPAIDIREGKCVRLRQGRFEDPTIFSNSPVDVARRFVDDGFRFLHVVDLDGAVAGIPVNAGIVREIAAISGLSVQAGGGVRSPEAVDLLLDGGVDRVILGSVALQRPNDVIGWVAERGSERFALAIDIMNGKLAAHGWKEQTEIHAVECIDRFMGQGIDRFICTDIARDGMMLGPAFSLYEGLRGLFPSLEIVASGGVSSISDLDRLASLGVFGTIVGRALLDGSIDRVLIREWMRDHHS